MPIGGKAYYDAKNDKDGPPVDNRPSFIKRLASNRGTEQHSSAQEPVVKSSVPATIAPTSSEALSVPSSSDRLNRPAKRRRSTSDDGAIRLADGMPGLDDVVSQVLDLAQKVHSIATQAEAAIVRAEAAVLKAELAVTKAEAAGARSEHCMGHTSNAVTVAEAAMKKAELFATRAELAATKAGLVAGKADLSLGLKGASSPFQVTSSADHSSSEPLSALTAEAMASIADGAPTQDVEETKTLEMESPLGEIALLSRKLRSGMRQIEQLQGESDRSAEPMVAQADMAAPAEESPAAQASQSEPISNGSERFSPSFAFTRSQADPRFGKTLDRDNVAGGLVRMEHEGSIPRVAPFIVDTSSSTTSDADTSDVTETESSEEAPSNGKRRNGLGYAV